MRVRSDRERVRHLPGMRHPHRRGSGHSPVVSREILPRDAGAGVFPGRQVPVRRVEGSIPQQSEIKGVLGHARAGDAGPDPLHLTVGPETVRVLLARLWGRAGLLRARRALVAASGSPTIAATGAPRPRNLRSLRTRTGRRPPPGRARVSRSAGTPPITRRFRRWTRVFHFWLRDGMMPARPTDTGWNPTGTRAGLKDIHCDSDRSS